MTRKPDYTISVFHKETKQRCVDAGAAWKSDDGSITLLISPMSPMVHLCNSLDHIIKLFPVKSKTIDNSKTTKSDDIPF